MALTPIERNPMNAPGRWLTALFALLVSCAGRSVVTERAPAGATPLVGGAIVRARCVRCHHQGGTVFSLETPAAIAEHGEMMAHMVGEGLMPAWLPSDECVALEGSRRLSKRERQSLLKWLEAGTDFEVPGEPWVAPPPPPHAVTLSVRKVLPTQEGSAYDKKCFELESLEEAVSISSLRISADSVPGLEWAEIFAIPQGQARAKPDAWDCASNQAPLGGRLVGLLSKAAPITRFPPGTAIHLAAQSTLVMRVAASAEKKAKEPRPVITFEPAPDGSAPLRFEQLEAENGGAQIFPMGAGAALRGLIPTGEPAVEGLTLRHQQRCLIDLPQWERQFSELYTFSAPTGVPLRENEWLELSCRRRETAAPRAKATCGFWLLLQ